MANIIEKQIKFRDTLGKISTFSHSKWEIFLRLVNVYILEFEDVLFHHNSAVLMPENPKGTSSKDGTEDDKKDTDDQIAKKDQETVTGVKSLALVFKELEFDDDKGMLIAAHTDTSGEIEYNFELSKYRARNVLHLLTGEGYGWATVSFEKHKVEDYQQIMKFFSNKYGCDPGKIDNKWGPDTKTATENFITKYNTDFCSTTTGISVLPEGLIAKIEGDSKKRWPVELWEAVYNLYSNEIRIALNDTWKEFNVRRGTLNPGNGHSGKFLYVNRKYVACGESFPIDDSEKNNYRSQENRRVEILFFDKKEAPPIEAFKPCVIKTKKHTDKECPLWHQRKKTIHFKQLYVDPNDLYAIVYHFSFKYYDRVAEGLKDIPEGLTFKAYEQHKSRGIKALHTVSKYKNGVYSVKVQYSTPLDDPDRLRIFFEIEMLNGWIYTKEKTAVPVFSNKTRAEINALPLSERFKYYDIPEKWSSKETLARYEGSTGGKVTDADILDAKDKRGWFKHMFSMVAGGSPKYKPFGDTKTTPDKPIVFCLDDLVPTGNDFKPHTGTGFTGALLDNTYEVINPDSANNMSYYTKELFEGKIIPFRSGIIKGVLLKDKLYTVHKDRVDINDDLAGHRAAVFEHKDKCIHITGFHQIHYRFSSGIGNFHAYLIRDIDYDDSTDELKSYIFNHFRWHFKGASPAANVTQNWIDKKAITNLINEWNDKANNKLVFLFHEDTTTKIKHQILIRYYMEHLSVEGQADTVVKVHPAGTDGRSYMSREKSEIRMNQVQRAGGRIVAAHEFGHASSLDDDYLERWKYCCYRKPGFVEFKEGAPYSYDIDSMMMDARTIRSRHYWHFAEWMSKEYVPGKILQFTVKKTNELDYTLPSKSVSPWNPGDPRDIGKHFYNYPDKKVLGTFNSKSNKGQFIAYLYPLGKDPYSQGFNNDGTRYGHALKPGKAFTALLVIKVNLYFEFKYSPSFSAIQNFLNDIDEGIKDNFHKGNNIKICGNKPYEDTFVLFQPRYLVHNYAAGYNKLNDKIINKTEYKSWRNYILGKPESRPFWKINVTDPFFGTLFSSSKWSRKPATLNLIKGDSEDFWEFFSQMIGLNRGEKPTKDNFEVSNILNGSVKNV